MLKMTQDPPLPSIVMQRHLFLSPPRTYNVIIIMFSYRLNEMTDKIIEISNATLKEQQQLEEIFPNPILRQKLKNFLI